MFCEITIDFNEKIHGTIGYDKTKDIVLIFTHGVKKETVYFEDKGHLTIIKKKDFLKVYWTCYRKLNSKISFVFVSFNEGDDENEVLF